MCRATHIVAALQSHLSIIGVLNQHRTQLKVGYKIVRLIQRGWSRPEIRDRIDGPSDYAKQLRAIFGREALHDRIGDIFLSRKQRATLRLHGADSFTGRLERTSKARA